MENENIVKETALSVAKETAKDVYADTVQPTAKNVGGFFGTLSGFFNHVVMYPLKKLNIRYEQKAIAFEKEMEHKYNSIPEKERVEPQLHIVGPTMESLKYNIMDDDLAELFSNLLVSDMDMRTQNLCTPAFVKVIEQLSPVDARVFKAVFNECAKAETIPICKVDLCKIDDEKRKIRKEYLPLYLVGIEVDRLNPNDVSKSLQNLERLGLLTIDFLKWRSDDEVYNKLIDNSYIESLKAWANQITGESCIAKVGTKGVDEWANAIRKQFAIDLGEQYKCSSTRQFYLYVRDKIETKGVFVHCFTDVTIDTARGFSIYNTLLPIIGINDEDRPPAKTFTIIHELVHLFKRESSLCNDMSSSASTLSEEVFCNAVAGELLVPKRALRIVLEHGHYFAPYSIDDIKRVADRFSVSREVIVRRLLELRKIDQSEYETYADLFRIEIEEDREKRKIQRENGIKSSIPRNMSREAIDRTSPSVSKILYQGYVNDVYSKLDIARHLNVGQNHIDKFLREVSKWNR